MLAIQYPIEYQKHFQPYTDFEVVDVSLWGPGVYPTTLDLWYDYTLMPAALEPVDAKGVLLPLADAPILNLINVAKCGFTCTRVATILGGVSYIPQLLDLVDVVALPHDIVRSVYYSPTYSSRLHYSEFCNLDELRLRPPRSLHTSTPVTAALMGIDLRRRERRPKKLPSFSYDLKLSEEKLDLAISNTIAIREALHEGLDNPLHT